MKDCIRALLVQARHDSLGALRLTLEGQSIDTFTAANCAEAAQALWSDCPPHLVFAEIQLADGDWADVLTLAAKACLPVNVIVVARVEDVSFYIETIERGAFDFIVPPLSNPEIIHVLRIAIENAISRRHKLGKLLAPDASVARTQSDHSTDNDKQN